MNPTLSRYLDRMVAAIALLPLLVSSIAFLASCQRSAMNNDQTSELSDAVTIRENTEVNLSGEDVGCANISQRAYTPTGGEETEGLTARLSIASTGEWILVGEGSEFSAGSQQWRVVSVTNAPQGKLTVQPVAAP